MEKQIKAANYLGYLAYIIVGFILISGCTANGDETEPFDWRLDWAVLEGFNLELDSFGFDLPSSIVFVPNPGTEPKDPLYYVAELGGSVKAVTNDRSVFTFVKDVYPRNNFDSLQVFENQYGLAGMCLAPEDGYLFVTYSYRSETGELISGLRRYKTTPQTFGVQVLEEKNIGAFLSAYRAAGNHQLGACQVYGEGLYIAAGDGNLASESQKITSLNGKLLRIDFDGKPVEDNPFLNTVEPAANQNYVWAYGFRNPFGLAFVGKNLYSVENGLDIDRFLQIAPGINYQWAGTDQSLISKADYIFTPASGFTHLDFVPTGSDFLPETYPDTFVMGTVGSNRDGTYSPKVLLLHVDLSSTKVLQEPFGLVQYQGNDFQMIVGVASGPDGIYFAPLTPNRQGETSVFKITYAPDAGFPYELGQAYDGSNLIRNYACLNCHQLNGYGISTSISLDYSDLVTELQDRLHTETYLLSLDNLDTRDDSFYRSTREFRASVRDSEGDDRLRNWMIAHLQVPGYDNPDNQMPALGINATEAETIADHLLTAPSLRFQLRRAFRSILPEVDLWTVAYAFLVGAGSSLGLYYFVRRLINSVRNRR